MLFNSFEYAIFLIIIFMIYWLSPKKFRCTVLMVSSFVFYGFWSIKYFLLFFSEIFTTYLIGVILSSRKIKQKKFRQQIFLFLGIGISVSVLILFKYYDFLVSILNSILQSYKNAKTFGLLNLILPVGISFYTFQCIGYMVDVYRGKVKVEKNFIQYAAFISFFPQLVAGPIERAEYLLPQIKTRHIFSYSQAVYGLKLMAWGYFKKIIIADTLAITVDKMWADMRSFAGLPLIIGAFFFSIQIYCDFSGYSDIARGSAKLLGIELSENFKSPYLSQSVKEFWGRWHISLSSWLRDYVYIPLGGNRKGDIRYIRNIMVTFFISGLWHGADWTFLAWGGGYLEVLL